MLSHSVMSDSPGIAACQAPLSMEFSRQKYQSGLPCPPPGNLPKPRIKPRTSLLSEPPGTPKDTGVGCHTLLQGISHQTQVSHNAGRFFIPSESPGKPTNTGVSSMVVCVSLDAFHITVTNCMDSDCNFLINDICLYNLNQATFITLYLSFFMSTLRSLFLPCRSAE